jgi:cell wall-associated NlpC family hydrolase
MTAHRRLLVALLVALLGGLLLACGGAATITRAPRWACPSPMPRPWGPSGPVKEILRQPRPTAAPSGPVSYDEIPVYYEEWEQEYGATHRGPPFPSPTPYARIGTSYVFGQRVEVWPLHALVTTRAGMLVGTQQLYLITIAWVNHTTEAIPVSYVEHVRLRGITEPNGAVVTDARWSVTAPALQAAGIDTLPDSIPPGASEVVVPVLAPPGDPETVDIDFVRGAPSVPPATPTPGPLVPLTVQWSNAAWQASGAAPCGDPGALTDWSGGPGVAWGRDAQPVIAAPPGSGRLLQIVANQVGKRYLWGAKGPEAFDCSGLATWSYAQIGVVIPQGTGGQWPNMRSVASGDLQPGDLVFFDIQGRGRIDHVGVLMGDLDGDGRWDMVHAASPELGVRADYGVFDSAFYGPRIRGFRTARQGGV